MSKLRYIQIIGGTTIKEVTTIVTILKIDLLLEIAFGSKSNTADDKIKRTKKVIIAVKNKNINVNIYKIIILNMSAYS
ncbi:hypothetical protein H6G95_29000 [Nostoc linckia FACHB-391]|uniref:Uncharacterized protein n=2 Tax=Nostoc TaxID=1177 RepID=A0ABR8IF84_9NOSO|nr:hypothetical protein [Nostoc linckia FACHB-391]MBD2650107.1 hypothetical protein [Nostoc foliaceum FACHB-393]